MQQKLEEDFAKEKGLKRKKKGNIFANVSKQMLLQKKKKKKNKRKTSRLFST